MLNNITENKQGIVLIMTLLILTSILVVTLAIADLVVSGVKMSRTQERSTRAYFAAEAGAERILWEARNNNFNSALCFVDAYINFSTSPASCFGSALNYTLPNNASYSVIFKNNAPVTFSCSGVYLDTARSVQISYSE